jgi:glutamyl-tRNA reductase
MPILSLGISFRSAPFDLLERVALAEEDLTKAYRRALDLDGLEEAVLLSTCNRVEVYGKVAGYHAGFLSMKRLLTESPGADSEELAEAIYSHWEEDATEHLFSVAAGLDSMVIGETQIQSQVRQAIKRATEEGAAGPEMTDLFQAALRAGRRVREETELGASPDAYVALGARIVASALGGLSGRDVVVVGAGHMASLAAAYMRDAGAGSIQILNRSPAHAESLAARTGATHGDLSSVPQALSHADLVVSATGAAGILLTEQAIREAVARRSSKPLAILDIAVPRDVEHGAGAIEGVTLVDIETLRAEISVEEAAVQSIEKARDIVAQEVRRTVVRRRADALAPLITAIRKRGDEVARSEIERNSSKLAGLTPQERDAVEALARGIVNKLLHDPLVELKERSEPGTDGLYAKALTELLGLDPEDL